MAQTIRTKDEILAEYNQVRFKMDNFTRQEPQEFVRERMPRYLRGTNNDEFYEFVRKILSYTRHLEYWIWILQSQFSVETAKGEFLDNLGRWLGLTRPPLAELRTNEPVVIFPNEELEGEELEEFNSLHGLTDINEVGVQYTYYPSTDFVGETLVNDEEYRIYIKGMLQLRKGISYPTIIDIFTRVLTKPFFVTEWTTENGLIMTAHYDEDAVRLVIARELTARIRTTGYNIQVLQATSSEPEEVTRKYGEDCWNQPNPYYDEEEEYEEDENETPEDTEPEPQSSLLLTTIKTEMIVGEEQKVEFAEGTTHIFSISSKSILEWDETNSVLRATGEGTASVKIILINGAQNEVVEYQINVSAEASEPEESDEPALFTGEIPTEMQVGDEIDIKMADNVTYYTFSISSQSVLVWDTSVADENKTGVLRAVGVGSVNVKLIIVAGAQNEVVEYQINVTE